MIDQAERLRIMVKNMGKQVETQITGQKLPTRTICVSSGKGGVGKTNLTLNLALALTEFGQRVLILDADMGMANVEVILGKVHPHNLYHVITGQKQLQEIVSTGPNGIQIISGGSGIPELANLEQEQLMNFVDEIKKLDGTVDFFLIDTGAGISRNVLSYICASNALIIVTTPEPTAITDAYGLIKSVESLQPDMEMQLVVNRIENEAEGEGVTRKLQIAVKQFLGREIEILGFIPEDPSVVKSVRSQRPFLLSNSNSPASLALKKIAAKLSNAEIIPDSEMSSFFHKIAHFFNKW